MKRHILTRACFISFLTASILSSCTIETSSNGDFDGYWHLTAVDTLSTGTRTDLTGKSIFWAVNGPLIQTYANDRKTSLVMHFNMESDTLHLFDLHVNDREQGDIPIEDPAILAPYGINSLNEKYYVSSLSSSRMTLETAFLRLSFRQL